MSETKKPRGTADMSPEVRRKVASAGGKAVSWNKEHMAKIGRKGGKVISQNRGWMSTIGSIGGQAPRRSES
jgi:general stress protein YciG